jgi:hypothetical protein
MYQCVPDPDVLSLPDPHLDPLKRGTDTRTRIHIRIRTKMSRIRNAALEHYLTCSGCFQLEKSHNIPYCTKCSSQVRPGPGTRIRFGEF